MKIKSVRPNGRKKAFEIQTRNAEYVFPYAKLPTPPNSNDPVEDVFPDPELGKEAFTYRLRSGVEESVHIDDVLEFAQDPDHLNDLLLYQLTVEALKGLEDSSLGKRQISRLLGTSASQLYRLLDPTNRKKSVGQMLALLHLLDREIDVVVTPRSGPLRGKPRRAVAT